MTADSTVKLVPSQRAPRPLVLPTKLSPKPSTDKQVPPDVDFGPIQPLVTQELATVKAAASSWAGSISTLVGLGSVFGLTVGKETILPLVSSNLWGRGFVLVVVVFFGLGVVFAQVASQGSLFRSTVESNPAEMLFRDTVKAIRSARKYMTVSRWLVGFAALATWVVLLWTVWALGVKPATPPVYYLITGSSIVPTCSPASTMRTDAEGGITRSGKALPPGATVAAVSSCPVPPKPAASATKPDSTAPAARKP